MQIFSHLSKLTFFLRNLNKNVQKHGTEKESTIHNVCTDGKDNKIK